jgi:eukaryotic-like serine/threonine-protein kinase
VALDARETRRDREVPAGLRDEPRQIRLLEVVDCRALCPLELGHVGVVVLVTALARGGLSPALEKSLEREILRTDHGSVAHVCRTFDGVLELADVPRVVASGELGERLLRDRSRTRRVSRQSAEELANQGLDVFAALGEGWQHDPRLRQAVVEIVSKLALVHHASKVTPRGCDDAHRRRTRPVFADPHHLATFEHPEQLRLKIERELTDFVEEYGAAVRGLEHTFTRCDGAGERPRGMTEQHRLGEVRRQRRTIEDDERLPRAATLFVERTSHELFATSGRSFDEDGQIRRREPLEQAEELTHRLASAKERSKRIPCRLMPLRLVRQVDTNRGLAQMKRGAGRNDRAADARPREPRAVPTVEVTNLDPSVVRSELEVKLGHGEIPEHEVGYARAADRDFSACSSASSRGTSDDRDTDTPGTVARSQDRSCARFGHGGSFDDTARLSLVDMSGRYTFVGTLASGGMGTVFLARMSGSAGFSRLVAVKRLLPELAGERDFITMLVDEARLASQIRHVNVIDTLDLVVNDGAFSVVLEYIEGAALSSLIGWAKRADENIPRPIALALMYGILRGLDAAHEARGSDGQLLGIVHRDVSPQNVLVGVDGIPRIIDFGIAKAMGRMTSTRPGEVRGKFAYMAPEQLLERPVTRQADVYAAGVLLWELLTGQRLFKSEDERAVIATVLRGEVKPPSAVNRSIPRELDAIVLKAIAREVSDRYLSARELLDTLAPWEGASDDEVGAWVRRLAAVQLARTQALLQNVTPEASRSVDDLLAELAQSSSPMIGGVAAAPQAHEETPPSARGLTSRGVEVAGVPPRHANGRTWMLLTAACAIGVLGLLLGLIGLRHGRTATTIATPPPTTSFFVSPPAPAPTPAPIESSSPVESGTVAASEATTHPSTPTTSASGRKPWRPTKRPSSAPPLDKDLDHR